MEISNKGKHIVCMIRNMEMDSLELTMEAFDHQEISKYTMVGACITNAISIENSIILKNKETAVEEGEINE